MNLKKPTIQQIKSGYTEKSFKRGEQYYKQGNILSVKTNNDSINAYVLGTQKYDITISPYPGDTNYYCTCPYDYEGYCKHIVAVLLYASKHFDKMIREEIQRRAKRDDAFFGISAKRLKEFLRMMMDENEDLEIRFIDYFGKDDDDVSLRDYKSEINILYKMDTGTYGGMIEYGCEISFDKFIKLAKTRESKGDYFEAARIHQEISEAISDNMEMVDDSDGYYGDCFSDAINGMVSCMNLQILTHTEK